MKLPPTQGALGTPYNAFSQVGSVPKTQDDSIDMMGGAGSGRAGLNSTHSQPNFSGAANSNRINVII